MELRQEDALEIPKANISWGQILRYFCRHRWIVLCRKIIQIERHSTQVSKKISNGPKKGVDPICTYNSSTHSCYKRVEGLLYKVWNKLMKKRSNNVWENIDFREARATRLSPLTTLMYIIELGWTHSQWNYSFDDEEITFYRTFSTLSKMALI